MNREIKFRVWHNRANKMLESGSNRQIFSWKDEGQDIAIMQFTGLHDKNGKEIYEGDILLSLSWGAKSRNKRPYHIVEWFKTGWKAVGYNGEIEVRPDLDVKNDFEVIGNIYENPELLK